MKTREVIAISLFGLALLTGCNKAEETTPTTGSSSEQVTAETAPAPATTAPAPAPAESAPAAPAPTEAAPVTEGKE